MPTIKKFAVTLTAIKYNRLIMEKCQTVSQSNAINLMHNANMHILDSARKREKERRRVYALFGDIDRLRSFQRFAAASQPKSIVVTIRIITIKPYQASKEKVSLIHNNRTRVFCLIFKIFFLF